MASVVAAETCSARVGVKRVVSATSARDAIMMKGEMMKRARFGPSALYLYHHSWQVSVLFTGGVHASHTALCSYMQIIRGLTGPDA